MLLFKSKIMTENSLKSRSTVLDVDAMPFCRSTVLDVDAMPFCRVSKGAFFLGSGKQDELASSIQKKGAGEHNLDYDYWLARFPVTLAQFRQFAKGTNFEPGDPRCLQGSSYAPVAWVSWDEALAFCSWLDQRWREKRWLPEGYQITLPSEPEWEKAAKGGYRIPVAGRPMVTPIDELCQASAGRPDEQEDNTLPQRLYPWGNFPLAGGTSPYGCEDMIGNVWEWTRSLWGDYPYPEDAEGRRQREGDGKGCRVLRGGSFYDDPWGVRCAFRHFNVPDAHFNSIGFRVVVRWDASTAG